MAKNTNYNGNTNLVKEGVQINWTPQMIAEFKKCKDDPVYFIETYGKIISVDDGLVPFKLYDYQREILSAYPTNLNICLNTARQAGKTSIITAIILHFVLFNKGKRVAILANKESQAIEILERIQTAFEYLPMWLKGGVKEWNKKKVVLESGSQILAAASSSSAIRGRSCVAGETKVCVEDDGHFFYVEIELLLNKSKLIHIEENPMLYAVYRTINKINNKEYIGFHGINPKRERLISEKSDTGSIFTSGYLGSGKLMKRALEKYGPENMCQELLLLTDSREEAEQLERELVNEEYVTRDTNYNVSIGGNVCILTGEHNGFFGRNHTQETLDKIQKSRQASNLPSYQCAFITPEEKVLKGFRAVIEHFDLTLDMNDPNVRLFVSEKVYKGDLICEPEAKNEYYKNFYQNHLEWLAGANERKQEIARKTSERFKGVPKSAETREKIGKGHSEWVKNNPEKHAERMEKINKNPEKIRKMAEKHRGMKRSEEARRNMSEAQRGRIAKNKGKVSAHDPMTGTIRYFDSKDSIPEGWVLGLGKRTRPRGESHTNGTI